MGQAMALVVAGTVVVGPTAMASYNTWGTLSAYEGTTLVPRGRGTIGVDFNADVIGGHVTSLDPRRQSSDFNQKW